jgi:hypothetical protein
MGLLNTVLRWFGRGYSAASTIAAAEFNQEARVAAYGVREAFYDNSIYLPQAQGGLLETIMRDATGKSIDPKKLRVQGWFNPVPQVVDAYGNLYPGTFGRETRVADDVHGQPVNPALVDPENDPIGRIWRASNFDTEKTKLTEWGANLGTVGIRIVATDDPDPLKRRVALQLDHPRRIADFDEDDRGNCTAVLLRYELQLRTKLGDTNPHKVKVEELLSKDGFSLKYDGVEQLTPEEQVNRLGVCPYVIVRHRDRGERWGQHAYAGAEPIIHSINYLVTRQDKSIDRHVFPKWFAATSGAAPQNINLGEESVAYAKMDPDSPPPLFQPLVASLNQADTRAFWLEVIDLLRERCPEMLINHVKLISGVSGETLAQVLKPAEARILAARALYDHALTRAIQIALSWGIILGLWDLGTGTGTPDAADRAYLEGKEAFEFADRPALPQSVYDRLKQIELDEAPRTNGITDAVALKDDLSHRERLRMAGYSDEQIEQIDRERRTEDTIPTTNPDDFGGAGPAVTT